MPGLGEKLADEVLDRRRTLPRKPAAVTLEGTLVKLVPLDLERDLDGLYAASDGRPNTWGERRAGPAARRRQLPGEPPRAPQDRTRRGFACSTANGRACATASGGWSTREAGPAALVSALVWAELMSAATG